MKHHIKKITAALLLLAVVSMNTAVFAASGYNIVIDGKESALNNPVYSIDGYDFVPAGEILTLLGAEVTWNSSSKTVTAAKDDKEAVATIGSNTALVNGKGIALDTAPRLVDGKTYVSIGFFRQAMGYNVEWLADSKTVYLNTPIIDAGGVNVNFTPRYDTNLTVDEAYKRALSFSNDLKTLTANMNNAREGRDELVVKYTFLNVNSTYVPGIDVSDSIRTLMNQISKTETNLKNEEYNRQMIQGALELQIRASFTSIISAQNTIALEEADIELSKIALEQSKLKLDLGMISQVAYQTEVIAYEKKLENHQLNENALADDYLSLNKLLGYDSAKRYNVVLNEEYKPIDKSFLIDNYATTAAASQPNVRIAQNALFQAERDKELYSGETHAGYLSTQSAIEAADRDLDNTKKTLEQKIRQSYNNLKDIETKIVAAELDLTKARTDLEVGKVNYETGNITELTLLRLIYASNSYEKVVEALKYSHILTKFQLDNPYLL